MGLRDIVQKYFDTAPPEIVPNSTLPVYSTSALLLTTTPAPPIADLTTESSPTAVLLPDYITTAAPLIPALLPADESSNESSVIASPLMDVSTGQVVVYFLVLIVYAMYLLISLRRLRFARLKGATLINSLDYSFLGASSLGAVFKEEGSRIVGGGGPWGVMQTGGWVGPALDYCTIGTSIATLLRDNTEPIE